MAGDGGRVPDVSGQRAETWEVVVCNTCNVVLGRDGKVVLGRPSVPCSHLNTSAFVRASDPASVLAALLAENPEATVAAIEALLTSDEQLTAAHDQWQERVGWRANRYELRTILKASVIAACRSLLSKAPKEDGESDEGGNQ
jgi:hypothetical protein